MEQTGIGGLRSWLGGPKLGGMDNASETYYRPKRIVADLPDFAQQYLGEFATMEWPLEDRLACWYHVRCEMFDRSVSAVRDPWGDAVPTRPGQWARMNANAEEVVCQLEAAHPELPRGKIRYAIRRYGQRYTTARMIEMLERLNETAGTYRSDVPDRTPFPGMSIGSGHIGA